MDAFDKIMQGMGPANSSSSSSNRPSGRAPLGRAGPPRTPAPATSSSSTGRLFNVSTPRIPKRENPSTAGPDPKRRQTDATFNELYPMKVQLNSWVLDLSKMDGRIAKLLFQATIILSNGSKFEINLGMATIGGDVNRQIRRTAQQTMFLKWCSQNKHLFRNNNVDSAVYDAAETIYVPECWFIGGVEEHICTLSEADFSEKEWAAVAKLSRRKNPTFEIRIKATGFVETKLPMALTEANRPDLARCVEIVTSQVTHNGDFFLYESGTYPIAAQPLHEPDKITEIKPGFSKTTRIVEGPNGQPRALLTVDTASSAFYKPSSLMKFIINKMGDLRNPPGRGGGNHGGHRGGFGGDRRGGHGNDRYGHGHGRDDRYDQGRGHGGDRRDDNRRPSEDFDPRSAKDLESDFSRKQISGKEKNELERVLKGLDCMPLHLENSKSNRYVTIYGFAEGTAVTTLFEQNIDGQKRNISVADYFAEHHGIRLKYPDLPLISSRRRGGVCNHTPIEVLSVVPGQRIKTCNMTPEVQGSMTGRNSALPEQHVETANKILTQHLKLGNQRNKYLEAFGISMPSSEPIKTMAKILAPPTIVFAGRKTFTPNSEKGNVRIMSNGTFVVPARIRTITIINYDDRFQDVRGFAQALTKECNSQGIKIETRCDQWRYESCDPFDNHTTKKIMSEAKRDKVTIVIGIVAEKRPDMHDTMKYFEEKMGQQTIQLSTETVIKITRGQGGRQTTDNVMRKFNPKCGGTNFFLQIPNNVSRTMVCQDPNGAYRKLFEKTQFIGFEMSHTGARTLYDQQQGILEGDPTVVGVAYSLHQSTQLGGFAYYQDTRLHKLTHLDTKLQICLKAYFEQDGKKNLPEVICVFRVGSGEGDFRQIIAEVEELKAAASAYRQGYRPKFVVICVLRHSRVRIFRDELRGLPKKAFDQNVPSGTCVENLPTSHSFDEFILCCQTPLIGTVRPTKYTVLVNDAGWSKNEIQNLTYFLAFGHQVSFAPPAVPDVLYAASNLAKRGHNNWKTHNRLVGIHKHGKELSESVQGLTLEEVTSNFIDELSKELNSMTIAGQNFWA